MIEKPKFISAYLRKIFPSDIITKIFLYNFTIIDTICKDNVEAFIVLYNYYNNFKKRIDINDYIHDIATHGSIKILKYLIAKKIKIDFDIVKNNLTTIIKLLKNKTLNKNMIEMFKLLLEKSKNPFQLLDIKDKDGNYDYTLSITDLIYQENTKERLILIEIINNFIDMEDIPNDYVKSLMVTGYYLIRTQYKNKEMLSSLLNNGIVKNVYKDFFFPNLLNFSIKKKNFIMGSLILKNGGDINSINEDGSILIKMVKSKNIRAIEFILKNGGNVNIQDKDGNTALHHSHFVNSLEIQAILFKYKPSPYIKNNKGETFENLILNGISNILKMPKPNKIKNSKSRRKSL